MTLSLDLTTISALYWIRRCRVPGMGDGSTRLPCSSRTSQFRNSHLYGSLCLVAWMALSVLFFILVFGRKSTALDRPGMTDLGNGILFLEPKSWDGHRLPILESIDIRQDLELGEWTVVLLRESCPHCQEVLQKLLTGGGLQSQDGHNERFAIVDFDGTMTANDPAAPNLGALRVGHVDTRMGKAFVVVPVMFHLQSGIVGNVQSL